MQALKLLFLLQILNHAALLTSLCWHNPKRQHRTETCWTLAWCAWLQLSLVKARDLDSYVEEQGAGAALTVDAVRKFEVLVYQVTTLPHHTPQVASVCCWIYAKARAVAMNSCKPVTSFDCRKHQHPCLLLCLLL